MMICALRRRSYILFLHFASTPKSLVIASFSHYCRSVEVILRKVFSDIKDKREVPLPPVIDILKENF